MCFFEQHVSDEGKDRTSTQANVLDEDVVKSKKGSFKGKHASDFRTKN